jgi:hypothetical protein
MSANQDHAGRERRDGERSFLPTGWGILAGFVILAAIAIVLTVWMQPWDGEEDNVSVTDGVEIPAGDDNADDGDIPGTFDEAP